MLIKKVWNMKKELAFQEKALAKLRRLEIEKKCQARKLQDSGWTDSQWSGMTCEERLIRCDHFQKTGKKAKLDFLREEVRKAKKAAKSETVIVLVKK